MRTVYTLEKLKAAYSYPQCQWVIKSLDGELREDKQYIVVGHYRIDSSKISVVVEELDFGGEKG